LEIANAMGVLAEIAKRMFGAAEGTFAIHHRVGAEQRTQPCREGFGILKRNQGAMGAEFVLRMQFPQAIYKLAPEHFPEDIDRQEELPLRVNPPGVVWSQSAGRNDAVNVRMSL
jgi:hypothetical protein